MVELQRNKTSWVNSKKEWGMAKTICKDFYLNQPRTILRHGRDESTDFSAQDSYFGRCKYETPSVAGDWRCRLPPAVSQRPRQYSIPMGIRGPGFTPCQHDN